MNIVPQFGLGTFRLTGDTVIESVKTALEVGYRAVDTAQIYGNETEVGQAIELSGINRHDLFLTTKIWTENYSAEKYIEMLKEILHILYSDVLNLSLIH